MEANFTRYLESVGYRNGTVRILPVLVKDFFSFSGKEPTAVEKNDIEKYLAYLTERPSKSGPGGLSSSYINHHRYALKVFFDWQHHRGERKNSPLAGIAQQRVLYEAREVYSLVEINQLYVATENEKERASLALFYGCGLRRAEAEQLKRRDIDFRKRELLVREGKGGRSRRVPMSEKTTRDLLVYSRIEKRPSRYFILNRNGGRMRGESYLRLLKELGKRAGIKKKILLHSFRHSIATHLLAGGMNVECVRDFLGHKQLESTMIYTRVSKQQLWALTAT
ncbi:tyrosine-type recombinase/integrase [Chitinophagales bacterium]|nr:tyrosine-type recombinase/integrase [Chitinophagales bacterium]